MIKEKIFELILIGIITIFVLTISSCSVSSTQCAAYASVEQK